METKPLVLPEDENNKTLVANVHPPEWKNPEPASRYNIVVIGAGTAGLVTAAGAAGLGAKVALIERHLIGGDCLNVGCVPSKGIIRAARAWREAARARAEFGGPMAEGAGDFPAVMARMRRLRAGMSRIDGAPRFRDLGVDVFLGAGRFAGPDTVEVDGTLLRFRRAIIATGGRPAVPPIRGLADVGYLTNETVFGLIWSPVNFFYDITPAQFQNQGGYAFNLHGGSAFGSVANATEGGTNNNAASANGNNIEARNGWDWSVDERFNWQRGRHLLKFGADVDALDGMFAATPLVWAVEGRSNAKPAGADHVEVARALIAAGSSLEWTPPPGAPEQERTREGLAELRQAADALP